jgi:hypothetical protein
MDLEKAFLIIFLTIAAVVIFNVMIFLSVRRGNEITTIDLMRKAARRARNPWKDEEDALQELSDLVSNFKSTSQVPTDEDEQEESREL